MKLGVISDTHDRLDSIDWAFKKFQVEEVTLIVHCGDWTSPSTVEYIGTTLEKIEIPLIGVMGNRDTEREKMRLISQRCDLMTLYPQPLIDLDITGTIFQITHGHDKKALRELAEKDYDILLRGHSHKPLIVSTENKLLINPGSTAFSIPRSKDFHPTVALYSIENHLGEIIKRYKLDSIRRECRR